MCTSKSGTGARSTYSYNYIRFAVRDAMTASGASTVCIPDYSLVSMLKLSAGTGHQRPLELVSTLVRQAYAEVVVMPDRQRTKSALVRAKVFKKLRGMYRPHLAAEYERAQFPDGVLTNGELERSLKP